MNIDSFVFEDQKLKQWQDSDKGKCFENIKATVTFLEREQIGRITLIQRDIRTYNNAISSPYTGPAEYSQYNSAPGVGRENRLNINVAKSCVDTVCSKISKNKIKPTILSDGAEWNIQRKAQNLDRVMRGVWTYNNVHNQMRQIFKDASITGTGCLKIITEGNSIKYERVLSMYLLVDDLEALYGKPRSLYQYTFVDRNLLMSMYENKNKREAIAKANAWKVTGTNTKADIVRLYEAWHLPSGNQKGRHVICLDNFDLLDEEWSDNSFPFIFFNWCPPQQGFWGQSLINELWSIQSEISKLAFYIQNAVQLGHAPKWMVSQASSIPNSHFTNKIGDIIKYTGTMPTYIAPQMFNEQLLNMLNFYIQQAYRITGVSELSARAEKPSGLNSGKALQTYNDIETERMVTVGQNYEDAHIELYYRSVEAAKRASIYNPNFELISYDKKTGVEKVKWSEIDMDREHILINAFPSSMLPNSPEGRLAFVEEMLAAGKIDDETAMELLDFPDTASFRELRLADIIAIKETIADIIEKGSYKPPEEFDNLDKALEIAHRTYLRLRTKDAPEETLQLLRQYMEDCKYLLEKITPPVAPAAPTVPAEGVMPTTEQPIALQGGEFGSVPKV